MHQLGLQVMNRVIAIYDLESQLLNMVCTAGSYLLAVSTFPFLANLIWSVFKGKEAGANPWKALTLEWQTTSPPLIENFEEEPVLWSGPYDYGIDISEEDDQSVEELLSEVKADMS
jgi:cytochrome c oxidase subunit 1